MNAEAGVTPVKSDKESDMALSKRQTNPVSMTAIVRLDPYGIPLHPTPTEDELDPLNWTHLQKRLILFIVCFSSFLGIYLQTVPSSSVYLLMDQFNTSYTKINWTLAAPALTAAASPILLSSLGDIYGRRPVLLCCSLMTILTTGCTTIPNLTYGAYLFLRLLQGFGSGLSCVISFGLIRDISFEHERGLRTGLWVLSIDTGFISGAIMGGFTANAGADWAQYSVVIAYGVILVLQASLLPETLYPRERVREMLLRSESLDSLPRTKKIRLRNWKKIPGMAHPRPLQSTLRFFKLFTFPKISCAILPFMFLQYWWSMSVVTMEAAAYATFSVTVQGLLFIGFALGIIISEVCCSGQLSDYITSRLALRHNETRTPEMRLWLAYPGIIIGAIGSVLWGISVDRQWHWLVGQVALFLLAFGLQVTNVGITTYVYECYPNHPLEVLTFYCVIANLCIFIMPFFIDQWVSAVGYTWCFVTEGLMTLVLIPIIACLQKWGDKLDKEMQFQEDNRWSDDDSDGNEIDLGPLFKHRDATNDGCR